MIVLNIITTIMIVIIILCIAILVKKHLVPRGLEPRTLRLLAVRSNQLSYETIELQQSQAMYSLIPTM